MAINEVDKSAQFQQIFREYYPMLCHYAFRFTHNTCAAEDLVQDAFINIWEKRDKIDWSSSLLSLLFIIVKNKAIDWLRSQKKNIRVENCELENYTTQLIIDYIEQNFQASQITDELERSIQELPAQCRKVYIMKYDEMLKNKEIALRLNISIKTVEKHISEAHKRIKLQLAKFILSFLWFFTGILR